MKIKIIIFSLLFIIFISTFNSTFATSNVSDNNITLDNFNLTDEQLALANENGYIILTNGSSGQSLSYTVTIFRNSDFKAYLKDGFIWFTSNSRQDDYTYRYDFTLYHTQLDFHNDYTSLSNFEKNCLLCTIPIYTNNEFNEIYREPDLKDDTIGDKNSRLKLSYEYNEDFTSCHIDATLKGGEFTDSIYYSNIAPSISGQGLLSKKSFPRERYRFN